MMGSLVTLMVIMPRKKKIENTFYIKKDGTQQKYSKEKEIGRQCNQRLNKKYNNTTQLRLSKCNQIK